MSVEGPKKKDTGNLTARKSHGNFTDKESCRHRGSQHGRRHQNALNEEKNFRVATKTLEYYISYICSEEGEKSQGVIR